MGNYRVFPFIEEFLQTVPTQAEVVSKEDISAILTTKIQDSLYNPFLQVIVSACVDSSSIQLGNRKPSS